MKERVKEKPIQYFNPEYVERCRDLTPDQILQFLEDWKQLYYNIPEKCRPISLKVEPTLLRAFKTKAKLSGVAYQTQIKKLMKAWVEETVN